MPGIDRGSVLPGVRILVVEDELPIQEMLALSLGFVGYEVFRADDARGALALAEEHRLDLALLDVMLPDLDGITLLSRLREAQPSLAAIFLTARDSVEDRIAGLTRGGDDYVTKPFSLEEVVTRIGVVLRRTHGGGEPALQRLTYEDLVMDEEGHQVWRGEQALDLSPTEFALLRYLMRNAGKVVSKAQILDQVWHYDFNGTSSVVESYISYLRRKVDAQGPALIHTVRGVGYTMRLKRS